MSTETTAFGTREPGPGVAWYTRPEVPGPWRIAACPEHGRELERHRFRLLGATVEGAAGAVRDATVCEICRRPETLAAVERCACEIDPARCPEHQNVGCGG